MSTHTIRLQSYRAIGTGGPVDLGTAGSHGNEQLQIIRGNGWDSLTIQVIFHPCKVAVQLPPDGLIDVPWEATAFPLSAGRGRMVFQGFDQGRLVNSTDLPYTVAGHSPAVGRDEKPYTPGIVEGVLNQMAVDKADILAAAQQTGQAKEEAASSAEAAQASAVQAAAQATAARKSADDAQTAQTQAAGSADNAASHAAAAGETLNQVEAAFQQAVQQMEDTGSETLRQIQDATQQALQQLEDNEAAALKNIAAAAPALPAVSSGTAWQSVTVQPGGIGYNLAEMAPISAAIRPTATGNPAVCQHSIAWRLQDLKIYGKSIQNGTPSPEHPIPIVNTGDAGFVTLNLTDGASQSQSLTFSTPNGLLGVPVQTSGNHTDENGQQWVCNFLDQDGIHRICKTYTTTGNENWTLNDQTSSVIQLVAYVEIDNIGTVQDGDKKMISNIGVGAQVNPGAWLYETALVVVLPKNILPSGDLAGAIAWIKDNPVTVVYIAKNPVVEPLSPDESAACRALTTYNGSSVLSVSEESAIIKARYVADGTSWLESAIEQIAAPETAQANP